MKKYNYILLISAILLFSTSRSSAQASDCGERNSFSWVKASGSIENDEVYDITSDASGNIYITGFFNGTMQFQSTTVVSNGGRDFFLAKLGPEGDLLWIKTGGSTADDYGTGVITDNSGNVYVTGTYEGVVDLEGNIFYNMGLSDIFLIKYSSEGVLLWAESFGSSGSDNSAGITIDNSGNVIITGTYSAPLIIKGIPLFNIGGADHFVAKFNGSGSLHWVTNYGSAADDYGIDVTCDNTGNIYVMGEFSGTIRFGVLNVVADGAKDIFIAKLNSTGNAQWVNKAGENGSGSIAGGIASDIYNNVYFCYKGDQLTNMGIIKRYTTAGVNDFNLNFGNSGRVYPNDIKVDEDQNIYVTGMFISGTDFGDGPINAVGDYDYFLVKYRSDALLDFKHVAGSTSSDCGNAVSLSTNKSILTGGLFNNTINFGTSSITSEGRSDIMAIKYEKYFSFSEVVVSSINCDPANMCINIETKGGTPPLTYNWSNGSVSKDICGINPGNYSVTVTDNTNCRIVTSINVTPPNTPVIPLPPSITACPFETVELNAGSQFVDYVWSTGETTSIINVSEPGNYSVTITDENACTASANVNLTKRPNMPLFTQDNYYFCFNEYTNINVPGYQQYEWSDGTALPSLVTNIPGEYWLKAYNGTCHYYDTINIYSYPEFSIDIGADRIICHEDSVRIIAPNGFRSYLWQDNSNLTSFWAKQPGLVYVQVTDRNNCKNSDTVNIEVVPRPVVNLGNDITACSDNGIILYPNNPVTNTSYLWNTGSRDSTTVARRSGKYWLRATHNTGGCIESDTINVTLFPLARLNLPDFGEFCIGDSAKVEIMGDYTSILWDDGYTGNTIYISENDLVRYVTVTDTNGCSTSDSVMGYQHIVPYPFLGLDTTYCEGDVHTLRLQQNYHAYLWNDGTTMPFLDISQAGTYRVTVYDNIGCVNSSSINIDYQPKPYFLHIEALFGNLTINVEGGTPPYLYSLNGDSWQESNQFLNNTSDVYTVYVLDDEYCLIQQRVFIDKSYKIPNFFTPNGDGHNDYWVIDGLYQFPKAVVKVFDRQGKVLHTFGNENNSWDGTYMGNPLPSDTYWYIVDLGTGKGVLKGSVTIKR